MNRMQRSFFMLLLFVAVACKNETPVFEQLHAEDTGINFVNTVIENDSINPLDLEFLYNGGGIAVGDFNNDSLPDLYFTASMTSNKLYLNKGNFRFDDVTTASSTGGDGRWSNAATVVDINQDGLDDIYVCATIYKDPGRRANLLYINQGTDEKGIPRFREMAGDYNLADTGFSVQASFLDYDLDGDLDMYLVTTQLAMRNSTRFDGSSVDQETKPLNSDRLFRNEGIGPAGHPVFRDVSDEAGIADNGYGLAVAVSDLNADGWPDIYVTNDFLGSDLVYINNRNGGFTNRSKDCMKHTSQNAMGLDIADINNDGLQDIISADMNPEDNYRKKKNLSANNYFITQNMQNLGYTLQYVRNTLQLNQGNIIRDSMNMFLPLFSDISFYAGVAETDWSWSTLMADMDNDGYRDILITNGYPRDVTDHDFASYRNNATQVASREQMLDQIPQIKVANYAFRNTGNLKFANVTSQWNMNTPSFSNGAVCVDLDLDGDLDYVINNINDPAFVYRNHTGSNNGNHYLNIKFSGEKQNKTGIGCSVTLYYENDRIQFGENFPTRGYLSSAENGIHFGLGKTELIDSLVVRWPGGMSQVLKGVKTSQTIYLSISDAGKDSTVLQESGQLGQSLFTEANLLKDKPFRHEEMDHIDFNMQRLLPHKLSQYGPGIASGDINGDGLDDMYIGGSAGFNGTFLIQQQNGTFIRRELELPLNYRRNEQMGVLLFDADNDGDPDLYTASGSYEFKPGSPSYRDYFFINDGKGNFTPDTTVIPLNYTSKGCVKAADYDNDGDLDLFIAGRVYPEEYPRPVSSFIYRNDSKNGSVRFTDIKAPVLKDIGMICDALWTDYDNDGWTDLLIAGEWMPLTLIKNEKGAFTNITSQTGFAGSNGWWNSLAAADFDRDGDIDYIAGNLGLNSYFRTRDSLPVGIYANDFDQNRSYDAVPFFYLPDTKGNLQPFPMHTRDDMIKQMIGMRMRFPRYQAYATSTIYEILNEKERKEALLLTANEMRSVFIKNLGGGKFEISALPADVQLSPIYGMITGDFNNDGIPDVAAVGNDFGTEVHSGQLDALNGLVLTGTDNGKFNPLPVRSHGLFVPGNGKALASVAGKGNQLLLAASQNRGDLKLFRQDSVNIYKVPPDISSAIITWADGKQSRMEFYFGHSFLSQSARYIRLHSNMKQIALYKATAKIHTLSF